MQGFALIAILAVWATWSQELIAGTLGEAGSTRHDSLNFDCSSYKARIKAIASMDNDLLLLVAMCTEWSSVVHSHVNPGVSGQDRMGLAWVWQRVTNWYTSTHLGECPEQGSIC